MGFPMGPSCFLQSFPSPPGQRSASARAAGAAARSAKKLLHDNAILVEQALAVPITPDFVPVAPPPSPIDMPMDFKVLMSPFMTC